MTTTGSAGFSRFAACRNSSPLMPGSLRSVRTRWTGSLAQQLQCRFPRRRAERVSKPASPRSSSSRRRILASSSTMRMVGIGQSTIAAAGRGCLARGLLRTRGKITRSTLRRCADSQLDRAVVPVHDFRNDGKAKAHAGFLGGHKRIEDLLAQFAGNARTGVGEPHFDSVASVMHRASGASTRSVPPSSSLMAS